MHAFRCCRCSIVSAVAVPQPALFCSVAAGEVRSFHNSLTPKRLVGRQSLMKMMRTRYFALAQGCEDRPVVEGVMDCRTSGCAIAALVQKPSRDFPLKQGREQSPEIDIPSW